MSTLVEIFHASFNNYEPLGIVNIAKCVVKAVVSAGKGTKNDHKYWLKCDEETERQPMPFCRAQHTAHKRPKLDRNEDWTRDGVTSTPQAIPVSQIEGWPFSSRKILEEVRIEIAMELRNSNGLEE